jgi:hypothetical protein
MGNNKIEALRSFNKILQEKIKNLETKYFIESKGKDFKGLNEEVKNNYNDEAIYLNNYVLDTK